MTNPTRREIALEVLLRIVQANAHEPYVKSAEGAIPEVFARASVTYADALLAVLDKDAPAEKPPKVPPIEDAEADAIYALYPRRQGRADALKAIKQARRTRSKEFLTERVLAYAEAVAKWPPDTKHFIPMPATWFHQGRYDDDPATWVRTAPQAKQIPNRDYGEKLSL
jgi:hypothetical protein